MNAGRLFFASCVALVTTSMVFSIRGDILDALSADFHINKQQTGMILSPAFWGFTISILVGGSLVDFFGMRRLLTLSSWGYIVAVLAILFAPRPGAPVDPYYSDPGFLILYAAMLTLGLSQGLVEGVINPLCATLYSDNKTHRMNVLHAWWPGGLIIGGLAAYGITKAMGLDQSGVSAATATLGWQIKLGLLIVPAVAYWFLIRGQRFPETERVAAGVSTADMCREALRPLFILLWIMMWMTAATELGPDQWVGSLITNLTGMQGVLILVYTAGLMFVLRFFAGGVAHHVPPHALLAVCSALAAAGLFGLSRVTTPVEAFVDTVRCRQDVFLADHARHHRGAISEGRSAPAGDHGGNGESFRRVHSAHHGRMVRHGRRGGGVPICRLSSGGAHGTLRQFVPLLSRARRLPGRETRCEA